MPSEAAGRGGNEDAPGLGLIVHSGDFARVHYALVMASAAAAIDRPVTLFFTMAGLRAILRSGSDGTAGWLHLPGGSDDSPAATGAEVDARYRAGGVAGFEELLNACVSFGVRFLACEMGLKAAGLDRGMLRADLPIEQGGVVTLLAAVGRNGALLMV
ncbi:MAG: hypothetical protein EA406_05755 [Rhodospirillales bacterium]|nr:MAG: hypothetical protein EA406_05755 [Rhodospirillales bacterium]